MTTESMYGHTLLVSRGSHRLGVRGRQPGRFACDGASVQERAPTPDQLDSTGDLPRTGRPSRVKDLRLGWLSSAQLIFESEDFGG